MAGLPEAVRERFSRRIPGVRLGCLAIRRGTQHRDIGTLLLADAILRRRSAQGAKPGFGPVVVDAIDDGSACLHRSKATAPVPKSRCCFCCRSRDASLQVRRDLIVRVRAHSANALPREKETAKGNRRLRHPGDHDYRMRWRRYPVRSSSVASLP